MKFWVGTTDNAWFRYLAERQPPVDEVNFWQPSAAPLFSGLPPGTPFLFKLKKPNNHIAGGGYFVRTSSLPLSMAWATFETRNGCASLEEFEKRLGGLRRDAQPREREILCTVLSEPFFLESRDWLKDPEGWSGPIVRGKTYDTNDPEGRQLWSRVAPLLAGGRNLSAKTGSTVREQVPTYGEPMLVRPRLGQGGFRLLVADAYQRRCAITGENTLPVLEAAHIKPYAQSGMHDVSNGLFLRSDFHKLFDCGLVTVTPELRIRISTRIRDTYFNGKVYYRLDGCQLQVVPKEREERPNPELLAWHNVNVFHP
jgi:putative restriction endonuclease